MAIKGKSGKPDFKPNRKYNTKKVLQLAKTGISATLIAKDQGVAISTITTFLNRHAPQLRNIKVYNDIRADMLSLSQLKNQTIEAIIKDRWIEQPEIIKALDVRAQKEVLHTLQGGRYYDHQMERLERGQSTNNINYFDENKKLQDLIKARQALTKQLEGTKNGKVEGNDESPAVIEAEIAEISRETGSII